MTDAQRSTVEMLASVVDSLETAPWSEFHRPTQGEDGWLVFVGRWNSQDGPAVGYIKPDGQVDWICGG